MPLKIVTDEVRLKKSHDGQAKALYLAYKAIRVIYTSLYFYFFPLYVIFVPLVQLVFTFDFQNSS